METAITKELYERATKLRGAIELLKKVECGERVTRFEFLTCKSWLVFSSVWGRKGSGMAGSDLRTAQMITPQGPLASLWADSAMVRTVSPRNAWHT